MIRERDLTARLLGTGMTLTILALTVPRVASSTVKSRLVLERIREALEIESGFNDGISLPFLLIIMALSVVEDGIEGQFPWLTYTLQQTGFGVLAGLVIGLSVGWLMTHTEKRGWMVSEARQLVMLSVAVLSWFVAGTLMSGNGFIAAFVAGGAIRHTYSESQIGMRKFNLEWGNLLVYLVFYAFGMIAAPVLGSIPVTIWLCGILSLAVVRILAVRIAKNGSKLKPSSIAFLGWFGPRGLASVILGIIYLNRVTQIYANSSILLAMIATVLLSMFAHGITANPLIRLYARYGEGSSAGPSTSLSD